MCIATPQTQDHAAGEYKYEGRVLLQTPCVSLLLLLFNTAVVEREGLIPPMDTIQNQFHPPVIHTNYLLKIHLNVIFQSYSRSLQWTESKRFTHKNFVCIPYFPSPSYMPSQSQLLTFTVRHTVSTERNIKRYFCDLRSAPCTAAICGAGCKIQGNCS
jgi:hypothetical protein